MKIFVVDESGIKHEAFPADGSSSESTDLDGNRSSFRKLGSGDLVLKDGRYLEYTGNNGPNQERTFKGPAGEVFFEPK